MANNTRPTKSQVVEGLGALFVIAVGLVGIPLLLALIVGWPLPHHFPTATQLHSAAGSQIPDSFWPKALATIAWVAWGYFVFSLTTATSDVVRFRRRGTWRRAAGKTSMAALVTAVIVLASVRAPSSGHGLTTMPAAAAVVHVSPAPSSVTPSSRTPALIYTVVAGDSLFDIALNHYGDGEQWPTIYAANVGVRQPDGRALDATHWIYPGWKLSIPDVATPTPAPTAGLAEGVVPVTTASDVLDTTVTDPVTTGSASTYTVVTGDSLWSIAAAHYGNPEEWEVIYAANVGHGQPGGAALSDPSLIYPGWTLTIPAPAPLVPSTTAPVPISSSPTTAPPPATTAPISGPSVVTPSQGSERVHTEGASQPPRHHGEHQGIPELPAVAIGGLGVLAAAVIARSLRRRRRLARVTARPGEMISASSAPLRDLESALAALLDTPDLDWLDLAMCHLTQLSEHHPGSLPLIRLIRVGPDGVDLILAQAAGVALGAFEVTEDGWAWTLPATTDLDALRGGNERTPWFSALVPVGEDENGLTYLAPIEPGAVLPVSGPGAEEVVAGMATTAANWSWTEHVTVTDDPSDATARVQQKSFDPTVRRDRVLYLGSPNDLAPEVLSAVGVLTTDDVVGSDLALLCGEDGTAEVVPTQLRLRACRLTPQAHADIAESLSIAETPPSTTVPEYQMVLGGTVERESPAEAAAPLAAATIGESEPKLEVRLLTNAASIAGSEERISREGRHFELVALISLSGGLSKEEARAAIYGTGSSTDNIANIASQARKMLGTDSVGHPYLPEASSRGVLALSPQVTSDLARLCDTVSAAKSAEPSAAIVLYIAALSLIEATPGSTIDHSWNWWIHYAGIAEGAALGAACGLARLTIDAKGDLDIARHGINQARALAPYAEELYRSAIELAGAAGNLGWAQREWDGLRQMLSDLSPGASPSPETEAAYRAVMQPNDGESEFDVMAQPLLAGFGS